MWTTEPYYIICILLTASAEAPQLHLHSHDLTNRLACSFFVMLKNSRRLNGDIADRLYSDVFSFLPLYMYNRAGAVFHTAFQWAIFHTPL